MAIFLYLICLLWLVVGLLMLIVPQSARKLQERMAKIKDFRPLAAIPIVIGVLFFLSAESVLFPTLAHVFGIIALLKGLITLTMKKDKILEIVNWWNSAPDIIIRMWGVLMLCFMVLLFKCII